MALSAKRLVAPCQARQGNRNKGAEHLVSDQSVARLEAFFGVQHQDTTEEPALSAHPASHSLPLGRPQQLVARPGSSLSASPSSTAAARQQLGASQHAPAAAQPALADSTRRHHKRLGQLDQSRWMDPSASLTAETQAGVSGSHQAAAVQSAVERGAAPALDNSSAAARTAGKQQATSQQQRQQQQAAAPAVTASPAASGFHLPQVALEAPDLSHLSELASSTVMSAGSRLTAHVPQLPSLEWEAPTLLVPRIALPKVELPALEPPQLPSFSLPQLPKLHRPRLPELPSIELQGVDLEALNHQLGCMREFSAQQWANLRTAAARAVRLSRQAESREVQAPAQQQVGQQAAVAGSQGQQQLQRRQQKQQQAAPMGPPAVSPQQLHQVERPVERLGTWLPAPQSHHQQQQAAAIGGPSHHAMTAEAAAAEGLHTSRREQQSTSAQAVEVASPIGRQLLPRLGLQAWRTGGLTAWGWAVLLILGALAAGGVRVAQGRRQHAAQQAVREAEQRARDAQRKERQRRRFQRALLAAEDFEGSSVDSIAFTSVSKKRGGPSVALKDNTSPPAGSATDQGGSIATSNPDIAPVSGSVREAAVVSPPGNTSPAGSATAAPGTDSGVGREGLLAEASASSADHTTGQDGAQGALSPSSKAAATAAVNKPGLGAAAAGDGVTVVTRDPAGENPFLRGMGALSTFSFDDGAPEDQGAYDALVEDEGGEDGDDVYNPRSWDQQTRREWDAFVNSSKVGQGKLWDTSQIDLGLPQTHIDLDKD
ncbi:hypothetical protein N2152v2_005636 [Parachlorella kessleri]